MVLEGSHLSKDNHLVNYPSKHFGISAKYRVRNLHKDYLWGEPTHLRPAYLIYAERVKKKINL